MNFIKSLCFTFVALLLLSFTFPVHSYEFKAPDSYNLVDVQAYLSTGDGPQKLATAVCYGPFLNIENDKGVAVGEVLRGCGAVTYDNVNSDTSKGSEAFSGGPAVNLFSLMGVSLMAAQDPFEGEWRLGFGVSVAGIYRLASGTYELESIPRPSMSISLPWGVLPKPESISQLVKRLPVQITRFNRYSSQYR